MTKDEMKKKTNCPNCGASIEPDQIKCPFCGTRYIDIESLGLYEPTYLRLKIPDYKGKKREYIVYAAMRKAEITQFCDAMPELELSFDLMKDKNGIVARVREPEDAENETERNGY